MTATTIFLEVTQRNVFPFRHTTPREVESKEGDVIWKNQREEVEGIETTASVSMHVHKAGEGGSGSGLFGWLVV
jgi:hypothetical protein